MTRRTSFLIGSGIAAALLTALPAAAQTVGDTSGPPPVSGFSGPEEPAPLAEDSAGDEGAPSGRRGTPRPRVEVTPYIEIGQVLSARLSNGGDVLTYSSAAAGVEASVSTRRVQLAADVRYERRFSWDDELGDNDAISGLVRGRIDVAPGLALEAGALASRASVDGRAGSGQFTVGDRGSTASIYSVYAGPTFGRRIGDFDVGAAYRFGYSKADIEFAPDLTGAPTTLGTFDESTNHAAIASIGMRPGRLPFGWRASGGWEREDAGQLDQRYEGLFGRLDVTVPVTPTLALVGGIGVEDIEVSYRPPLLTPAGQPVVDSNGRLVADTAQSRQIAFDTSGLIWDAGVLYRPNRRTTLEARVGRRYDSWTYTGSWSMQTGRNSALQLSVYDGISTFGRQLSTGLAALPTDFDAVRNPIDGNLGTCAFGQSGGNCLTPALANANGLAFRNRGAVFSVSSNVRPWSLGFALGYDRRSYVLDGISGLAGLDGVVDETFYAFLSASRPVSDRTSFGSSLYATYFDSGLDGGNAFSGGASAALSHVFAQRLTGNAAVSVNTIDPEGFEAQTFVSALLGLRYSFR